jgi:hypothetical protein
MPSMSVNALHNACIRGDVAAVSRLLPARGTPLNLSGPRFQSSPHKTTPLMNASCGGHVDIVRLILDRARNTDVDHADKIGSTALLVAAQYHHACIVRLLADHGASVNHAGPEGRTPLRLAVGLNHDRDAPPRDPDPDDVRQIDTVWRCSNSTRVGCPPRLQPLHNGTAFFIFRNVFSTNKYLGLLCDHVRADVPRPVHGDSGRGEAPQAVRRLPRPRLPREVLRRAVPTRGLGVPAPRGVRRGAAGAAGCRHRGLSPGRAGMRHCAHSPKISYISHHLRHASILEMELHPALAVLAACSLLLSSVCV